MEYKRTFKRGDRVRKKGNKGQWHGHIVGEYNTECTPEGYAVESVYEENSVQIYPVSALELWNGDENKKLKELLGQLEVDLRSILGAVQHEQGHKIEEWCRAALNLIEKGKERWN